MIETPARVVGTDDNYAYVEPFSGGSCSSCSTTGSCGTAIFGKIFTQKPRVFRVLNSVRAKPGESVVIGLREGVLLTSSLMVYMIPLLFVFAGAILASLAGSTKELQEQYSIWGSVIGLVAGFAWVKWFHWKFASADKYQAEILRRG